MKRVAILGGGMASLVTALELSRVGGHDITLYQQGWRLGGKGASGCNQAKGNRIEEHGLHVLYGFYENVHRVMREVYAELDRDWDQAVTPHHRVTLMEETEHGPRPWHMDFPPNDERPGEGGLDTHPRALFQRAVSYAVDLVGYWLRAQGTSRRRLLARALSADLRRLVRDDVELAPSGALSNALSRASAILWSRGEVRAELRHLRVAADYFLALARGMLADGLLGKPDWFRIDDEDGRDWLRRHGAREPTLRSGLLDMLYCAAYSRERRVGAGTLIHGSLRVVLTYKGACLFKMRAGMGETIFAPIYEVLRRRGVRFAFFHEVRDLELSADRKRIARVHLERQANVLGGGTYEPLVDVDGLPCWPTEPRWEQLREADAIRAAGADLEHGWHGWRGEPVELEAGRDFDDVVLGISIGAFPWICRSLIDDVGNPRFGAMVQNIGTTQTRSAQLWLEPATPALGWDHGDSIVIPFREPFDTWADMAHLLAREAHGPQVRGLAYVTSHLDDDGPLPSRDDVTYVAKQRERVRAQLEAWLTHESAALWPTTRSDRGFRWEVLHDPESRSGPERLAAQHIVAAHHPSDRYVLALAGTNAYRLRATESGYANLVLAGDWTKTALSIGCVEAAAMSGHAAAEAIDPRARAAIGDWLPEAPARLVRPSPDDPSRLPPLIRFDGGDISVPPVDLDIEMSLFGLRADKAALQAVADRYLNLGGPTVYRPMGGFVVFYAAYLMNRLVDVPLGQVPEIDYGFWVPLVAGRERHGVFEPERVVTFTPYIWVDNGIALIGGRETYGFAKQLATMKRPSAEGGPLALDTLVLDKWGPTSEVVHRRLIEAEPMRGSLPSTALSSARLVANADRHGLLRFATSFGRSMTMVFLKQVPDPRDPRRAAYQAVVEAELPITRKLRGHPISPHRLTIHRYASHRIVDMLGLAVDSVDERGSAKIDSVFSGWATVGARVEQGRVIWRTA